MLRRAQRYDSSILLSSNKTEIALKFAVRMPAVPEPTARYPFIVLCGVSPTSHLTHSFQISIPQGPVEDLMLEPLHAEGIFVERLYSPSELDISSDDGLLQDPNAHPVTVGPGFF